MCFLSISISDTIHTMALLSGLFFKSYIFLTASELVASQSIPHMVSVGARSTFLAFRILMICFIDGTKIGLSLSLINIKIPLKTIRAKMGLKLLGFLFWRSQKNLTNTIQLSCGILTIGVPIFYYFLKNAFQCKCGWI